VTDQREAKTMNCEEFQSLLPELIATGGDVERHPHIAGCSLCKELIDDLNRIAEDARNRRGGEDWL
jgi:hypothetical protein